MIEQQTLIHADKSKLEYALDAIKEPFALRRSINDESLFEFVKYFWPEVSNEKFKSNWHIEEVFCKELEIIAYRVADNLPKLYDLIFNVPPGTTKTIVCSIMFPAWCWTKWYWMRFITASHSAALSLESAEYSRDLIRSDKFRAVYPELSIKEDKDTKSNFRVVKEVQVFPGQAPRILQGGNRYSTSVGGSLIGFHGHILLWDDLIDPLQAISEIQLGTANYWLDQGLSTRKVDKSVTTIIGIMQRLHQDDPTGHILAKQKKNTRHICLPGEIRDYREQVKPVELIEYYKDDLLDPVRMSWDVLKEMKADLGQYGYAGQVGQKPTPPGGGMFKVDHFNMITSLPAPVNFLRTVRYWDKAASDGKGAYTVGVRMHKLTDSRTGQPRFIIDDVRRGQWATEERERIILQTAHADGDGVEVGVEQEPGSGGKESAEGTVCNLAGFSVFKDKPDKSTGGKVARADRYSVQVNIGNVMLFTGDWNHVFVEEHRDFPSSTYKDQVDAGAGAFNRLVAKRVAGRVT